MPLNKLSSITADGARQQKIDLRVVLCNDDVSCHKSISYHCAVHLEDLCAKILSFKHVLDALTKVVNTH